MATIEELQKEVESYTNKILEICKTDKEIDELFKGVSIFFAPAVPETDLMFIGINPGVSPSEERVISFVQPEKSEYETEEYTLQTEWATIFGDKYEINDLNLLYKSFKTNCSFFITKGTEELHSLKSKLRKYLGSELDQKEAEWIKTLVEYINPRLIICEGFEAFNTLKTIFAGNMKDDESEKGNHKVAYIDDWRPVLGFKRAYSRFVDIEDVVDTLQDYMKIAKVGEEK